MTLPTNSTYELTERQLSRFWRRVEKPHGDEGCWKWVGSINDKGYGIFTIGRLTARSHRISFYLANGPIPENMFICHTCDNPECVSPKHLFPGTALDNARDCLSKGRFSPNPRLVLTDDEVREIRKLRASGVPRKDVAEQFHLYPTSVSRLTSGTRRATA